MAVGNTSLDNTWLNDFVADLSALAAADSRLGPIIARLTRPIRVNVLGRPGVGCRTVAAALRDAGVTLAQEADIDVLVVAETVKPEDRAVRAGTRRPVLTVLNKADLLAGAVSARVAAIRDHTGVPTVPMSALLATAIVDDELLAALRTGRGDRARLLDVLDRAGTAVATQALRDGCDGPALTAMLRRLSNLEAVLGGIGVLAAPVRYRRLQSALTASRALAARSADERLAAVLAGDTAVLAAMTAAAEVLAEAGLDVDRGAPLHRAVRWSRYSRGPVNALHRSCGADIARGALRLAARDGQLR